jgi:hypothetical protein
MEPEIDGALEQTQARLELAVSEVAPGGQLRYSISNVGEMSLLHGAGYWFERRTAKGWEPVPIAMAFPAWGRRLAPDEDTGAMLACVPSNQASGRYRLVTSVIVLRDDGPPMHGPGGPVTVKPSCEFSITG